ncbi:MAG: PadR family transcriptional regulator [Pseudomonadota bacterium]
MSLSEAILVCLTEGPQTGYDIAKTFQTSIGFFWHADHQRIYRELKKLDEAGFVEVELVMQTARPNKKVYSLTCAGEERLKEWSREMSAPPSIKDDMLVKLYALDKVDVAAMKRQIAARRDEHAERFAFYEKIEERRFANVDPTDIKKLGMHLGLQLGKEYDGGWVDWCNRALKLLDKAET